MNRLPCHKRKLILHLLVEGNSMRATARIADCSFNTVKKLLLDAGHIAQDFHDRTVRELTPRRIELDEIWAFCYTRSRKLEKAKAPPSEAGDIWTWTAIDPDTKLLIHTFVGSRELGSAMEFTAGLAERIATQTQITTDGLNNYIPAIEAAFGGDVDYAMLVKTHHDKVINQKQPMWGEPDPKFISTSIVERHNLTMRMSMRRYTRSTNAHSKKILNHCAALALHTLYYNFCRPCEVTSECV